MASNISPSKESIDFVVRVQSSLSARFGRPHLYKNFWFGVGDNLRLPTILFGDYIPESDSGDPTSTCMMRVFEVLVKHNPLLSLGPSVDLSEEDAKQLSKVM